MMEHPYKEYENTPIWSIVGQAITELVENHDIELQTPIEYVIGYICKKAELANINIEEQQCSKNDNK